MVGPTGGGGAGPGGAGGGAAGSPDGGVAGGPRDAGVEAGPVKCAAPALCDDFEGPALNNLPDTVKWAIDPNNHQVFLHCREKLMHECRWNQAVKKLIDTLR